MSSSEKYSLSDNCRARVDLGKEKVQRMIVIRHAEDAGNTQTDKPYYDRPLTECGLQQATEAGKRFIDKEIHYIITSPFLRYLQTAQQICEVLGLSGLHTCNDIVDVLTSHCGIHEQPVVPASDIQLDAHGIKIVEYDTTQLPRYPEETREGVKRLSSAYSRLANTYWPQNIVIVTHGYGVREAVLKGGGQTDDECTDYCSYVELNRFSRDSDKWTVVDVPRIIYVQARGKQENDILHIIYELLLASLLKNYYPFFDRCANSVY